MYVSRVLEKTIMRCSTFFPAILVTGARQVGKTTMLKYLDPKRKYVSLDILENRHLAQRDPQLFLQQFKPPIIIDEVQYAPELFPYLKATIDQSDAKGQYWLTASQKFSLMRNVSESLAGRIGIFELAAFSQAEIAGHTDWQPFKQLLN